MLQTLLLLVASCILGYYARRFYRRLGGAPGVPLDLGLETQAAALGNAATSPPQVAHLYNIVNLHVMTISDLRQQNETLTTAFAKANSRARTAEHKVGLYDQLVQDYKQALQHTKGLLAETTSALQQAQAECAHSVQALQLPALQATCAASVSLARTSANLDQLAQMRLSNIHLEQLRAPPGFHWELVLRSSAADDVHIELHDSVRRTLVSQDRRRLLVPPRTPVIVPQRLPPLFEPARSLPLNDHMPSQASANQSSDLSSSSPAPPRGAQLGLGRNNALTYHEGGQTRYASSASDNRMRALQAQARDQNIPFEYRQRGSRRRTG